MPTPGEYLSSDSGGNDNQPALPNSPMTSDILISRTAAALSHRLTEFRVGNATSRVPSCNGTMKFIRPIMKVIATKKIMIVPCAEKI